MKTNVRGLDRLGGKLNFTAAIVAIFTIVVAVFSVYDTLLYVENIKGKVTGYSPSGQGKSGYIPAVVYSRLDNGMPVQFSSSNRYLPKDGQCVEFEHFTRKYSGRNVYLFVRYC